MATCEQPSGLSSSYHTANVACYLTDVNTKKVYGVTNKHVALQADQVYIKYTGQNDHIKLGTSFKRFEDDQLDFGLIEIDPRVQGNLRNKENHNHPVRIYPNTFQSLYCKEVIKYKPNGNHYEMCKYETSNFGVIASKLEHDTLGVKDGQFLVKGSNGDFATKGESGTGIASKQVDGDATELIGLLCGGKDNYTVCIFFPFIIQYFEKKFDFIFQLYEPEHIDSDFGINEIQNKTLSVSNEVRRAHANTYIPPSVKIYFILPTPEQIAPLSFDLVKHVLDLLCMRFTPVNLNNYMLLERRQQELSLLVNERGAVSKNAIFENDRPEFVAIEKGISACDCLYLGKVASAETNLKIAVICVGKSGDIGMRLLCKLVTYITWYCLEQNSPESLTALKLLLKEGIDSFESDFKDLNGFPQETLGYLYFDYSRYYMVKRENECRTIKGKMSSTYTRKYRVKAIEKAKQAVAVFQGDHDRQGIPATARRLALSKCQCVYSILGCGHSFDLKVNIKSADVKEAEEMLNSIHSDIDNMPVVQNVDYLLALCDLQFRKGCVLEALDTAKKCMMKAADKVQNVSFQRAKCRVEILSKIKQ